MSRLFCNVYRGGRIDFTTDQTLALFDTLPAFVSKPGLAPDQMQEFRKTIEGFCRLSRTGSGERFIPGMPEAANADDAHTTEGEEAELEALQKFVSWIYPVLEKHGLVDQRLVQR